jgi:hypothetical protein
MLNATNATFWSEFGGCLTCPVCAFEYVHLQSVEVDQGTSIATVDAGGCRLAGRDVSEIGHRGSIIRLRMWCESGHRFTQVFRFHKGMTFVRVDVDDDAEADAEGIACLPELWRD